VILNNPKNRKKMKQEYHRLKFKEETISEKKKALILRALKENNGRITFEKEEEEDDDYPPATILYGRKDTCCISVTDVYTDEEDNILADGMDDDSGNYKCGFRIEPEQYSDILYFIGYVLGWIDSMEGKCVQDGINFAIMEMACQLAEKEMVDGYGKLPEYFADNNGEYTEFYRDIFNPLYDKYYNRLAELADFELVTKNK
jgi:hypothetical protein